MVVRAQVRQIRSVQDQEWMWWGDPEPGGWDTEGGDSGNRKERGEEVGRDRA